MEPYPEDLKREIMNLHPGFTESDFENYLRLMDDAHLIDPLEFPEESKQAEEKLADFVKTHLPRLEEAHSAYAEKMEHLYEERIESTGRSPVDIALAHENVSHWLQERTDRAGAYTTDCILIKEPSIYRVIFRFGDDSLMHVRVDSEKEDVKIVFTRVVNP